MVVADRGHGLLKVFSIAGALLRSFGGLGSGAGEFVELDDVEVLPDGVVVATDSFQSRLVMFAPDGTPLDVLGTYGTGLGQLATPAGLAVAPDFDRLLAASLNGSNVQVFTLSAVPPAPPAADASLAPTALQFPEQAVGTVSGSQVVLIQNPGDAPLGVRSVAVTGEFEAVGCGPVIDPGASCTLSVRFRPGAPGLREGSLAVELSSGGTRLVALAGSAFSPARLVTSAFSLVFPPQRVNTTSPPQAVRVLNAGTVTMPVTGLQTSGDFVQTNDCPPQLPPGAGCAVQVSFAPRRAGKQLEGSLLVLASAVDAPRTIPLVGQGIGAGLGSDPASLDFGVLPVGETSPARTVTITASGALSTTVGTLRLAGETRTPSCCPTTSAAAARLPGRGLYGDRRLQPGLCRVRRPPSSTCRATRTSRWRKCSSPAPASPAASRSLSPRRSASRCSPSPSPWPGCACCARGSAT